MKTPELLSPSELSDAILALCDVNDEDATIKEQAAALLRKMHNLSASLEELACLGNGDHYGNSDGNVIARRALQHIDGVERKWNHSRITPLTKSRDKEVGE